MKMMNLKYYLRGLGVGIVVTALIMGISLGGKKESLSNEEIKARAKELGMVEANTTLADELTGAEELTEAEELPEMEEQQDLIEPSPAIQQETPQPTLQPTPEPTPESTPEPTPAPVEEPANQPEDQASESEDLETVSKENTERIMIEVNKGDGSFTVCKRLEEAGLIASAANFDTFLCENGYDKRIRAGSFEIPADADPEQLARILIGTE